MESILTSIKKLLGIEKDYTHFDPEIVTHINSVFMILTQIGLGPDEGFYIEDDSTTWDEFVEDPAKLQAVKSYVHHKVRLLFDPPSNSTHMDAINRTIAELEWRLKVDAEMMRSK